MISYTGVGGLLETTGKTCFPQQGVVPAAAASLRLQRLVEGECWNPGDEGEPRGKGCLEEDAAFIRDVYPSKGLKELEGSTPTSFSPFPTVLSYCLLVELKQKPEKKGIPFTLVALPSIPAGWGIMESGCENKHTSIKWG